MAYNTSNPLGSTDPRDLSDNSENFDRAVNDLASPTWTDRFGNSRTTLAGQIGYIGTGIDGAIESYAPGLVLTTYSTIIEYNGEFYRPSASATLPYTTTATLPDVDSNLVAVGDAVLRQDLANSSASLGASLVSMEGGQSVQSAMVQRVIRKKTVAEIEALAGTADYQISLSDSSRAKIYEFDPSNLSTEVAADPNQVIYIAPSSDPTGASGAWVEIGQGFGSFGDELRNQNNILGDDPHWLEITNNAGDGNLGNQLFRMNSYGNSAYGNNIHSCRYFGDIDSPSAVQNGAFLMSWGFRAYDGVGLSQSSGAFQCKTTENWAAGAHGTKFQFETTPNSSTAREKTLEITEKGLAISMDGSLTWNDNYKVLEVSGVGSAIRGHVSQTELAMTNNALFDTSYKYGANGHAQVYIQGDGGNHLWQSAASGTSGNAITFKNVMEIDANYNWRVESDVNQATGHSIRKLSSSDSGNIVIDAGNNTSQLRIYAVSQDGANAANAAMKLNRDGVTNRSINAGGTVNASGADYAEYMRKADDCGAIAKGDIVGINKDGMLTDKFTEALSFAIKSTDPSYVGGDKWGTSDALGVAEPDTESENYEAEKAEFDAALEAERVKWDRVAFCGQVPVNISTFSVGDYIVPIEKNGGIEPEATSSPTLEQYISSVGKVISALPDGRANVIVKIS